MREHDEIDGGPDGEPKQRAQHVRVPRALLAASASVQAAAKRPVSNGVVSAARRSRSGSAWSAGEQGADDGSNATASPHQEDPGPGPQGDDLCLPADPGLRRNAITL
ncbi:hypothetical protein GCM10009727_00870 [Actinomadura napierensis]|uniref:Uncharacterized protein n=1 Tax=Actinomadura napierensis TaxID=267854 RepID=A0ABN2XZN0_9ACTN